MNANRELYDPQEDQRRLSGLLLESVRYIPLLTALLALGLLATFILARAGILGEAAWQVLVVAGTTLLAGLAQIVVTFLARRERGTAALAAFFIILALWAFSLVLFWETAVAIAILIVWVAPLTALAGRSGRGPLGASALAGGLCTVGLIWLDSHPGTSRLSTGNAAGLAAIILTASTVLLFVLGTTVVRLIRYRSLQSRLIVSFVLIITIPILFTAAISAYTAFTNSREQYAGSLKSVTSLKQTQIESVVNALAVQMSPLQSSTADGAALLNVLYPGAQTIDAYHLALSTAKTMLRNVMVRYPSSAYDEVLVLDIHGAVILSTYELDQGLTFADQAFFENGSRDFYAEVVPFAGKQNTGGEYKLVAAAPLYGATKQDIRGVIVTVSDIGALAGISGATPGITHGQTYLVGLDNRVISGSPGRGAEVTAWPIVHLILGKQGQTDGTYTNYAGVSVLGYGVWNPSLNAALVAEVPSADVYSAALSALLVSGLVGIFAILVAVIAALSTSQAVSKPIRGLAGTAAAFSTGNLEVRAAADQPDEVGQLALAFNNMADQLQGLIGNLEQRIAERTEALEQQTLRLRTAAEVARDAASAPHLDALLDQAGRLIMDRFGFYHTGIFLLDEKREYAVLRASPSEAGKKMLENQHKLRVGEQGIVGRVAATGEPRIALDTGVDSIYFSNPLLPNTHSEMALPLKTPEGTIGIIDIQSDQPEAFTQDDIAIVQVMADQLATAIQRTQLLQQVQAQLSQLEESQQAFTREAWQAFVQAGRPNVGYRFDNVRLEAIKNGNGHMAPVSAQKDNAQLMTIPVRLRGQTIGVVTLRFQSEHVSDTTTKMIQQIADRLATALENARLLEDSTRRANRERAIGEITSKISASVNMRNVLQTAVEELGRAIPGSDVIIQFRPDTEI